MCVFVCKRVSKCCWVTSLCYNATNSVYHLTEEWELNEVVCVCMWESVCVWEWEREFWALFTSPLLWQAGIREQSKYEQQRQQEEDEASLEPRQLLPFLWADEQKAELTTLKHVKQLRIQITRVSADSNVIPVLKYYTNCSFKNSRVKKGKAFPRLTYSV